MLFRSGRRSTTLVSCESDLRSRPYPPWGSNMWAEQRRLRLPILVTTWVGVSSPFEDASVSQRNVRTRQIVSYLPLVYFLVRRQ